MPWLEDTFDDLGPSIAVSGTGDSTCLVKADGTMWCRGSGSNGILGNGTINGQTARSDGKRHGLDRDQLRRQVRLRSKDRRLGVVLG